MAPADVLERAPGSHCGEEPRRDLRIGRIESYHHLFKQSKARAVGSVELSLVGAEPANQRAHPIWIGEREAVVVHEPAHPLERLALGDLRLQREPFVEDERLRRVTPANRLERMR